MKPSVLPVLLLISAVACGGSDLGAPAGNGGQGASLENGPERVAFLRYRPVLSNRRLKEEYGYAPQLTSREAFELYARARGLLGTA